MFNRAGIFIPLDAPFTHINLTIGTWPDQQYRLGTLRKGTCQLRAGASRLAPRVRQMLDHPGLREVFRWGCGMLKPVMIVEHFELRSLGRANAPCLPRFHGDLFDGSLASQLAELESVLATV